MRIIDNRYRIAIDSRFRRGKDQRNCGKRESGNKKLCRFLERVSLCHSCAPLINFMDSTNYSSTVKIDPVTNASAGSLSFQTRSITFRSSLASGEPSGITLILNEELMQIGSTALKAILP